MSTALTALPVHVLVPNGYNPNQMTDVEFRELVTEVEHLQRIPKPVVVRPHPEGGYLIVDGEHGWRAAKEVGLEEIPCEVIDVDDFEAMRQTYKRNQHGTHDPVLLGRMFKDMCEQRDLSARALAREIGVSEGTIRNALLYSQAAKRNPDADWCRYGIRQVREYLETPKELGDVWLQSGADIKLLDRATGYLGFDRWQEILDSGMGVTLDPEHFVTSAWRAVNLWTALEKHGEQWPELASYVEPLARLRLPDSYVDLIPAVEVDGEYTLGITAEAWTAVLETAAAADEVDRRSVAKAGIRLAMRQAGHDPEGNCADLRVAEAADLVARGPDWLRDADLPLGTKLEILEAEFPYAPEEDVEEAKRQVVQRLVAAGELLTRMLEEGSAPEDVGALASELLSVRPNREIADTLRTVLTGRRIEERDRLFADREKLIPEVVIQVMGKHGVIKKGTIDGREAFGVLEHRLSQLPEPELLWFAALLLGYEHGPAIWLRGLGGEQPKEEGEGA